MRARAPKVLYFKLLNKTNEEQLGFVSLESDKFVQPSFVGMKSETSNDIFSEYLKEQREVIEAEITRSASWTFNENVLKPSKVESRLGMGVSASESAEAHRLNRLQYARSTRKQMTRIIMINDLTLHCWCCTCCWQFAKQKEDVHELKKSLFVSSTVRRSIDNDLSPVNSFFFLPRI